MVAAKCQSKHKNASGGCADPQCPEISAHIQALDSAVKNKNLDSFIEAQRKVNMNNHEDAEQRMTVFMKLKIRSHKKILIGNTNKFEFVDHIDKTYIRQFSSFSHLQNYVKSVYKNSVSLNIMQNYPIAGVTTLSNIYLDPSIRGQGVGQHIVSMINATADHANNIVVLEPALDEHGRIKYSGLTDEEIVVAKKYHDKLVTYYENLGYTPLINYKEHIKPEAYKALTYGGSMIRLPQNILPKNFVV